MTPRLAGSLFGLAAFGAFSTHDAIIKALGATYSPVQIVFFSVLMGFPVVAVALLADPRRGTLVPVHPGWLLARAVAVVVSGLAIFYAFANLPLAQVYAILFSMPLIITVLSIPILGERVGWRRGIAVAVGLLGVLVVLRPGAVPLTPAHGAALIGAVFAAAAALIVRKVGRDERPVVLLLSPMIANVLVMGALLPAAYRPMPLRDFGALAVIAVLALAGTYFLIQAYRRAAAVIVAPMQYSQILWATVYGALFFDELPDLWTVVGIAIIVGAGIAIVLRENRSTATSKTPVLQTRTRAGLPVAPRISAWMSRDRD